MRSLGGVYKLGLLLFSMVMLSYIPISTSVSLDLSELRNSKIKVNPRGKLWATGHFMGRKSIPDSCESSSKIKQERRVMQRLQQRTDPVDQGTHFVVKLLKS